MIQQLIYQIYDWRLSYTGCCITAFFGLESSQKVPAPFPEHRATADFVPGEDKVYTEQLTNLSQHET